MKILVCDPVTSGYFHASFNATVIEALTKCHSVKKILVLLEKEQLQLQLVENIMQQGSIKIIGELPKIRKQATYIDNIRRIFLCYRILFHAVKKSNPDILILLSVENLITPVIISLFAKRKKWPKTWIIFHNNMENVKASWVKIQLWKTIPQNIGMIVLDEYVRSVARKAFPEKKIYTLPHPTYQHIGLKYMDGDTGLKCDFILLGRHSKDFNYNGFAGKFLDACSKESYGKESVIVLSRDEIPKIMNYGVRIEGYEYPMSEKTYWNALHCARYLVIPPNAAGRVTASGVLADALSVGLPVIAPNYGVFVGKVPRSCRSLLYNEKSIGKTVKYALRADSRAYKKMRMELLKMSDNFSLGNTSKCLNLIIGNENGN